jgi:hypothetical protein
MGYNGYNTANAMWSRLRKQNEGGSPAKNSPSKRKLKDPASASPGTRRKTVSRYIDVHKNSDDDLAEEDDDLDDGVA